MFPRPFPFVRQKDSMLCGITSLWMVCRHYGLRCSPSWIEQFCSPGVDGVSLKGIKDAADELGLDNVAGTLTVDALAKSPLPAIIHWNQNHFTVLYKVSRRGRRFHVADPAKGKIWYDREEFASHWESATGKDGSRKGISMFLTPGTRFGELCEEHTRSHRSMRFLMGYLSRYRRYFLQIFVGLLLGCVLQLVMPFLTQSIVDVGIRHQDIGFIWLVLLGELMIVGGRTATDFVRRWLLLHISMRVNISLVSDFFIKLLKLPMSFFDTKLTGDLLQRMSDHTRVQQFLTGQVLGIAFSFLSFLIFGVVLVMYNRVIFLIFLAGSVVYGIWIASFLKRRKVIDYELFEQQARNQNMTFRFLTSMQEIKLQDCERRRRWEWEDVQADLFTVQMRSLKLQQSQEAGCVFINEVKNILITVFAATAVIDGDLTLGAMLAVQYIVGQLNSPVEAVMGFIYSLQDVRISLERINEIHEGRNEETRDGLISEFPSGRSGDIEVRNVDFKYNRHAIDLTLRGVDITIPEGKVTAIVGASGSGKTTLIRLLLGYYPVNGGGIYIAGHDLRDVNVKWWRRQCGVVMQDGVIFSESISRNIAVTDAPVDEDRLRYAARLACIDDYVMSLPLKYDTKIGPDGVGLSQGQKQRVLIARAIYRDPAYIFLDEATNSLDAENERTIVENLAGFYKGRTVVVVAHRLSTVRDADNIVVLDGGRVVESGNHRSLIESHGVYYNLVKNQLELGG